MPCDLDLHRVAAGSWQRGGPGRDAAFVALLEASCHLRESGTPSVCQFVGMLLGGWLSDSFGRRPVTATAAFGLAVWAPIFFVLAKQESVVLLALGISVGAFVHGLLGGPEAAWIAELFPTRYRHAGSSLVFRVRRSSPAARRR